jgi:hypothetical protein
MNREHSPLDCADHGQGPEQNYDHAAPERRFSLPVQMRAYPADGRVSEQSQNQIDCDCDVMNVHELARAGLLAAEFRMRVSPLIFSELCEREPMFSKQISGPTPREWRSNCSAKKKFLLL